MAEPTRIMRVPEGTESFHLEEAYRHRRIREGLDRLYTSWGYLPAETPVFDFYDSYRTLLHDDAGTVYRLMDRGGELLLLRSDVTLFLAKQMGTNLTEADLPVRVWYSDTILRHQDREDISRNEFHQTGAELIGIPGMIGDLEILALVMKTIEYVSLRGTRIHIGSRAMFDAALPAQSGDSLRLLIDCVRFRDFERFIHLVTSAGIETRKVAEQLARLFSFIGSRSELDLLLPRLEETLVSRLRPHLEYIYTILAEIRAVDSTVPVILDLSEIGTQSYHTGFAFQAYMDGLDSSFASGGRYDKLLGSFGFSVPSVGFSLLLRKVEPVIGSTERFDPPRSIDRGKTQEFREAYLEAEKIRGKGGIATI